MKRLLAVCIISCCFQIANAQLANTSWTGTIEAGGNTINVLWKVATDTSYFYGTDDNSLLDVSIITIQDGTLNLRKISGLSSCGSEDGLYTFEIKDNTLTIYLKKDDCPDRAAVLDKVSFTKSAN